MNLDDAADVIWLREQIQRLEDQATEAKGQNRNIKWYQAKNLERFKHILIRLESLHQSLIQ